MAFRFFLKSLFYLLTGISLGFTTILIILQIITKNVDLEWIFICFGIFILSLGTLHIFKKLKL